MPASRRCSTQALAGLISQQTEIFNVQSERAQRFALVAVGRAWILLGSRKNSKPENYLKMRQNPHRPLHAVLGGVCFALEPVGENNDS